MENIDLNKVINKYASELMVEQNKRINLEVTNTAQQEQLKSQTEEIEKYKEFLKEFNFEDDFEKFKKGDDE